MSCLSTPSSWMAALFRRHCEKEIASKGPDESVSTYFLNDDRLAPLFEAMGYTATMFQEAGIIPQLISYESIYFRLADQEHIVDRISKATGRSDLSVDDSELLFELAAHVTTDIAWCRRIRDGVKKPDSRHGKAPARFFVTSVSFSSPTTRDDGNIATPFRIAPNTRETLMTQRRPTVSGRQPQRMTRTGDMDLWCRLTTDDHPAAEGPRLSSPRRQRREPGTVRRGLRRLREGPTRSRRG